MSKFKILAYYPVAELYDESVSCDVGQCDTPAVMSIITLGDEIKLCRRHLKQLYKEMEFLCDAIQEIK